MSHITITYYTLQSNYAMALHFSAVHCHIFAVMNFQVHSIVFHKASSCACACEYPLFMKGHCCIGRVNCEYHFACVQRS